LRGEDVPKFEGWEFEILPENWRYFRVYEACQAAWVESVCLGISAQEIESACRLEGVKQKDLKRISRGVREMSRAMVSYVSEQRANK
jgi:hypothetical protein